MATQIFFIFTPIFGEMIQFDEHIFQMGWNHQLVFHSLIFLLKYGRMVWDAFGKEGSTIGMSLEKSLDCSQHEVGFGRVRLGEEKWPNVKENKRKQP